MTGTAEGCDAEVKETYNVDVVRVPTIRPCLRKYLPDRFFIDAQCKWDAAVQEISKLSEQGRPVLVGSRTVQVSLAIAKLLTDRGIECQVLNGLQTADEAELVAVAGQRGKVTVATNMAGRGTDIRLGEGVAELGGLHVLGLERSVSPRIDGQLAGRVARQGDPGSCQFFVSADDGLIQEYAPELAEEMALRADFEGEVFFDFSEHVRKAQWKAEAQSRMQRMRLRDQDVWMDQTLKRLYGA
jgi:preprotein translocase subunit SecA